MGSEEGPRCCWSAASRRPRRTREAFLDRARRAVALLAAQPGCEGVDLGRAIEEPGRWVLVARFTTVTAYRRALQPFDVREHVVPLLSEALTDEPAAYERALVAGPTA